MVHGSIAVPRSAARALPLPWHRVMVSRYGSADGKEGRRRRAARCWRRACVLAVRPAAGAQAGVAPSGAEKPGRTRRGAVAPHLSSHDPRLFRQRPAGADRVGPGCVVARRSPEPVFGVDREQAARFPRPHRTAALREAPRCCVIRCLTIRCGPRRDSLRRARCGSKRRRHGARAWRAGAIRPRRWRGRTLRLHRRAPGAAGLHG